MPTSFPVALRSRVHAVFVSDYSLVESVERLQAVVVPVGFDADASESVMGTVTTDQVRLEHNQPWPSNQRERPYFIGSFALGEQAVVLSGQFVESRSASFLVGTLAGALFFGPRSFRKEVVWLSKFIERVSHWVHPTINSGRRQSAIHLTRSIKTGTDHPAPPPACRWQPPFSRRAPRPAGSGTRTIPTPRSVRRNAGR